MKIKVSLQKLVFLGLVVCLLTALIAFGCEQPAAKPATPTTPAAPTGPTVGGVLKIGISGDAVNLGFPPRISSPSEVIMSKTALETLGRFDAKGNIVPWLATEFKPDPKTNSLTVVLRKGVKFHDGTDFNAKACKWNLDNYVAAKKTELMMKSIDIIDDYTIRLNLTEWDADAIMKLSYYCGGMISPTAYEKAGATDKERQDWALKNPVGTGPFQFVSWARDVKQVYKKFPGYWQTGKPYLDGVEWVIIADPVTMSAAMKGKEIDVIKGAVFQSVKDLVSAGMVAVPVKTGFGTMTISFIPDTAHPDSPWSNLKVRQAAQHAIDSKAVLDALYFGYGEPTNQWSAPDLYSYNPNVKGYPYDPNKAKQLLKDAGYGDGLKTSLIVQTVGEGLQLGTAVQGFLKAVGIDAQIDAVATAKFTSLYQVDGWTNSSINRSARAWDVITQMSRYLHSAKTIYAAHKKTVMKIDQVDKLIDEAFSAPDAKTQQAKVWELQKVIIDDYALLTIIGIQKPVTVEAPKVQKSGFNTEHVDQWTPEEAWIK